MGVDNLFELEAIACFIDGLIQDNPDTSYVILLKKPDTIKVEICTNLGEYDLMSLLAAAAEGVERA